MIGLATFKMADREGKITLDLIGLPLFLLRTPHPSGGCAQVFPIASTDRILADPPAKKGFVCGSSSAKIEDRSQRA